MVSNDYYEIKHDKTSNRSQLAIKGFWRSPDVAPDYLNDWKRILAEMKLGSTVLASATGMKAPPPAEVSAIHQQVQETCLASGLSKITEVVSPVITGLSTSRIYRKRGLVAVKRQFRDINRAITWLDPEKE
ncbi:MAG: hypothetical protein ACFFD4_19725 [Candidatus Odinarchaeota archaeon]